MSLLVSGVTVMQGAVQVAISAEIVGAVGAVSVPLAPIHFKTTSSDAVPLDWTKAIFDPS